MENIQIITECDSDLLESINSQPSSQNEDSFEGYISAELSEN